VLEAKQSRWKGGKKEVAGVTPQNDLFATDESETRGRHGARRAWDVLMFNAKRQAEDYARALPTSHGWPPFILVCDVGHCIEIYADFSGQGKNYTQFPDRQSFRVYLEDLRQPQVQDRLKRIWNEPLSLDLTRVAAKVTREIAERLAAVSKALEAKKYPAEEVAHFLMRCLFTMFAEDVKLLPENCFRELLGMCREHPDKFVPLLTDLWKSMNDGSFAASIRTKVLRFNGNLFAEAKVLPLGREEIGELAEAANKNWREVEPAIFGTLLEQALDPGERRRLGAHYLQQHFKAKDRPPHEPILRKFRNIEVKDAVLSWDSCPAPQIVSGKEVYPNPQRPTWPIAEFVVGNPPFIGGKDIRARLGDARAEALWAAHKHMNESADFVMYWWDRAADILTAKASSLRRFGFVTTNSITQEFSRRVIKKRMEGKTPISLLMAIPDHPWTKATPDAAAVRIAMTVVAKGEHVGLLREVAQESALDTDQPSIEFTVREGSIHSDLTVGVDVTSTIELKSNEGLCSP
ncbi:MAG: class I SAM-dependent DNA methyltransferase, partial [Hyphomicrobiales bacterium]|nr:class I SAM-dependent DNA methyltransferase [Hyphomicrobiales bacterium]